MLRRYLHGADLHSMETSATARFYHHQDGLGSVGNVTNDSGAKQWTYVWEPFGTKRTETKNAGSVPANMMRFAGEYIDTATSLYHLRARQYDPAIGRFLATDPMTQPLSDPYFSSYVYADDRPSVLVDPSGLDSDRAGGWSFDLGLSLHFGVGLSGGVQIGSDGVSPYGGAGIGLDFGASASFTNSPTNTGLYGTVTGCQGYACASVDTELGVSAGLGTRAGVSADIRYGSRLVDW